MDGHTSAAPSYDSTRFPPPWKIVPETTSGRVALYRVAAFRNLPTGSGRDTDPSSAGLPRVRS